MPAKGDSGLNGASTQTDTKGTAVVAFAAEPWAMCVGVLLVEPARFRPALGFVGCVVPGGGGDHVDTGNFSR